MVDFKITRTVAKIVRNELQLNVEEIASRVGCKPGTILQLETGHWQPTSGKVFDYYERQWTAISDFNKQKSARILGLALNPEPVKHKPKRKIKTVKSKKYVRDDQYAMRFSGQMAQYLYEACERGMYESPAEYVRDLIRQDKLKRKMEEKYEAELAA